MIESTTAMSRERRAYEGGKEGKEKWRNVKNIAIERAEIEKKRVGLICWESGASMGGRLEVEDEMGLRGV